MGRDDTRTILTYGQAASPRSRWSKDQPRLSSRARRAHFPWSRKQTRQQRVDRFVVPGS